MTEANRRLAEALALYGNGRMHEHKHGDHYFDVEFEDFRVIVCSHGDVLSVSSRPGGSDFFAFEHREYNEPPITTEVSSYRLAPDAKQSYETVANGVFGKIADECRKDFQAYMVWRKRNEDRQALTNKTYLDMGLTKPLNGQSENVYVGPEHASVRINGSRVTFDRCTVGPDKARRIIEILKETIPA